MVAAGCNVREVSEWAGHNSVAFTLTRYGGLFEDNTDAAIDRLDALLGGFCDARPQPRLAMIEAESRARRIDLADGAIGTWGK